MSKGASKKKATPRPAPAKRNAAEVVKKARAAPEPSTSAGLVRKARQSVKNLDVATKKAAKRITKTRQAKQEQKAKAGCKDPRETIPGTRFALNTLQWSAWKLAMCEYAPDERDVWQERKRGRPGVRNVGIFSRSSDKAAVYEFAVQRKDSRKKYVVYSKATGGFSDKLWDAELLGRDQVQDEIDSVISKGCQLYVRRALIKTSVQIEGKTLSTPRQFSSFLRSKYDYSWRFMQRAGSSHVSHRQVDIGSGILVSTADIRKCTCVMCS